MKKLFLFIGFSLGVVTMTHAQDSTRTRDKGGFRVSADVGLLNNPSLGSIQQQLRQSGLDASGVGNRFSNLVFSFVRDNAKSMYETRILLVNSDNIDPTSDTQLDKRVIFYGYGLGSARTFKLVNNRRWVIGPTVAAEFMWYRLRILPQNSQSLSLNNIVANPTYYSTVTFRQGFYVNLSGAASVDYKTGWFKRLYDDFRIGARVGYQLPLARNTKWHYGDGTVNELPAFRSNMLFAQIGATFIMKKRD